MNPTILARFAPILLLLSIACEGGKKSTFQLPPDLGKGLSPADSLRAVLNYLEGRREYQAETLRFHYMYEYISDAGPAEAGYPSSLGASATELGPEESVSLRRGGGSIRRSPAYGGVKGSMTRL
jgi:hypothetical protein